LYTGLLTPAFECGIQVLPDLEDAPQPAEWARAVAFGKGFGVIEALLLGLGSLVPVVRLLVSPGGIPESARAAIVPKLRGGGLIAILLPIIERAATLVGHVLSSALLVYAVRMREQRWFAAVALVPAATQGRIHPAGSNARGGHSPLLHLLHSVGDPWPSICYGMIVKMTSASECPIRNALAAMVALSCFLHAQPRALPQPRFEVASVRMNRTAACLGRWDFRTSHGTLTAENAPLRRIISRAYQLTDDRVSGPSWIDSQCYDIRAKASGDAADRDLMPMLQTLLVERFHLVADRESEERPVFALVVDQGGSKLQPYGAKVSVPTSAGARPILFMARHLQDLCERLGMVTGHPVIDKTGLGGDYQIELTYLPYGSSDTDPSDAALEIFSAVRNQLGLRLDPQRAKVDVLKIQSVDKVPTQN
jgi:uncharacterized protein (TIGR03435 family)